MKQYCVPDLVPFPPLERANRDGLLATGGDLSAERLICAYSQGIFPWFEQGQPILWWSPDPRCVLFPAQFKASRSLRKSARKAPFEASFDQAFEAVIEACAAPRLGQQGTWITSSMHSAYMALHHKGCAHSVEVWQNAKLVGGLYGVALGRAFFGESMFSRVSDASKFALRCLCNLLATKGYHMIDCQLKSAHLMSLGAQVIPRHQFMDQLQMALEIDEPFGLWKAIEKIRP